MRETSHTTGPIAAHTVRAARFPVVAKGYDQAAVDGLLDRVAGELRAYEDAMAEARAELWRLRSQVDVYRRHDTPGDRVASLFTQAQRATDAMMAEAVSRAEEILAEAHRVRRAALELPRPR
jgi:DivIVA domain-containing protein